MEHNDQLNIQPKSIKFNMVINGIRSLMGVIFPLITFPYSSKILGVENIGAYNFVNSIISYFLLLAGLGVSTYAIREGAMLRGNKIKLKHFINEMFTISVIATSFAYVLLFFSLYSIPKFQDYRALFLILSLQIIFKTISVEWLFSIFEDFTYITIRSIVFQVVSIIALFVFVHEESDIYAYCMISTLVSVGTGISNFVYANKYTKVQLTKTIDYKKHLRPIFLLFATSITITIYVSSDTTILGFLKGDYEVGIYSVATKIYTIIKTLLSALLVVSIPRLAMLWGSGDQNQFKEVAKNVYDTLITLMLPMLTGLYILSEEVVLIVSNESYIASKVPLQVLCVAMFFSMGAYFWGQCILVPIGREKTVFYITIISAIVNIVLNFILIPYWGATAAAFTTAVAEGVAFIMCMLSSKKEVPIMSSMKIMIKSAIGCVFIIFIFRILRLAQIGEMCYLMCGIGGAISGYVILQVFLKNTVVLEIVYSVKSKLCKKS